MATLACCLTHVAPIHVECVLDRSLFSLQMICCMCIRNGIKRMVAMHLSPWGAATSARASKPLYFDADLVGCARYTHQGLSGTAIPTIHSVDMHVQQRHQVPRRRQKNEPLLPGGPAWMYSSCGAGCGEGCTGRALSVHCMRALRLLHAMEGYLAGAGHAVPRPVPRARHA